MKIEGGCRFESRQINRKIEGEPISAINEITIGKADSIPLPPSIIWPHSRIVFERLDQIYSFQIHGSSIKIPLYRALLKFTDKRGKAQTINLSKTTRGKPCYFTGAKNGFYAHDPATRGKEDHFYVIGIQPQELEDSQRHIVKIDHELGHAILMDEGVDIALLKAGLSPDFGQLPDYAGIARYADILRKAVPERWRQKVDPKRVNRRFLSKKMEEEWNFNLAIKLFHERYAWAAGIRLSRRRGSPTGFKRPLSIIKYAKFCLESYATNYGDFRFIHGAKKRS